MTGPVTENRAVVFDVQGFSIHDGPGIRTAVFFKGCPLDCVWCHNPESKAASPQLLYFKSRCTGCMLCVASCAAGAHVVLPDGTHDVDRRKCTACGKCLDVCCYDALRVCGKRITPRELCDRIRGDIRYFAIDGGKKGERGGITFTGGEPLLYADFIKEFCGLMPGVHTAVETSGYGNREGLEKVMDCADLFLFDIKCMDAGEHRKHCGVDNASVFSSLELLYANKKEIILRLPLVPGINDTARHFDGIAALLRKYPGIKRAEIMPYHNFGLAKAEAAGAAISPSLPLLNTGKETIDRWLGEFKSRGCENVWCA